MVVEFLFVSAVLISFGSGMAALVYFIVLSELRQRISKNYNLAAWLAKMGVDTKKIQKSEVSVPKFWIILLVTVLYVPLIGLDFLDNVKRHDFRETGRERVLFTVTDAGTDLNPRIELVDKKNVKWVMEFDNCTNTRILKKGATNWFVRTDLYNKWTGKSKSTIDNMQKLVCK